MGEQSNDLESVFSSIYGTTNEPGRILVGLRFLALQAVALGRNDLAGDLEDILARHEDDLDRPLEEVGFSCGLH